MGRRCLTAPELVHQGALTVTVMHKFSGREAAVQGDVTVHPYRWRDDTAYDYAASIGAVLADGSNDDVPSLCPASLRRLPPSSKVVLPSPNGATCALEAAETGAEVVAGCLRNAAAVAQWATERTGDVGVIACGEVWRDGSLLPAIEDLLGAAAIIHALLGDRSPEALVAEAAFVGVGDRLGALLAESSSGRALAERGHADDVEWAAEASASSCVPVLEHGRFVPGTGRSHQETRV